jgi:hypothetical protein
MDRKY